jgi:hypothetical protein
MVDFASSFIIHNTHALKIDRRDIMEKKRRERVERQV